MATKSRLRFTGPHLVLAAWRRVLINLTGKEPTAFMTAANKELCFEVVMSCQDITKIMQVYNERWEHAVDLKEVS